MKRYSLWVKSLLFFLAVALFLGMAVSGLGIVLSESMGMYNQDDYEAWLYDRFRELGEQIARSGLQLHLARSSDCPPWLLEEIGYATGIYHLENRYEISENEWCCVILDESGKEVFAQGNSAMEDPLELTFSGMTADIPVITENGPDQMDMAAPDDSPQESVTVPTMDPRGYYMEMHASPYTGETIWVMYQTSEPYHAKVSISRSYSSFYKTEGFSQAVLEELFCLRYSFIVAAGVSLLLFAAALTLLMILAGRDPKTGEANPRALNRLPLDLYLAVAVGITVLGCAVGYELLDMLFYSNGYNVLMVVLLCGCGIVIATVDVGFFTAIAAQFKVPDGFWWRHSICGRVVKLCWKLLRAAFGYVRKPFTAIGRIFRDTLGMLPVVWKWIVAGGALGIILLIICATSTAHWYTVVPLMLWCLFFAALVIYCGYGYGVIQKGIRRMNEGDLSRKIDTKWMYGSFKSVAEELNALADVAAIAAEKQLRSERMKTELITNVSHDIKTPLTSVINYVDLLQKPHTEQEESQYLEVLSRQSQRLKKLVEDLMDMSKASSGSMSVDIAPMDAVEAVNQALGEFADKLEGAELTPVFRSGESRMGILADGRLTWRVLSNLLSNVVKYALPGTRVYLDLLRLDQKVILSIKNISREELNISAEELTERFVRGDASRNTEGSGLGLNIAQSLMTLQRGTLELTVDGDLFKVVLTFRAE